MSCYYDILKIERGASFKEIKKSYRKLVFQYHPDKHNNAQFYNEKIKEINAAYECLSDSQKRKVYDRKFSFYSNSTTQDPFIPRYNPSVQVISLTFKESYFGCLKQIKLIDYFGNDYPFSLEIPGGINPAGHFTIPGNSRVAGFLVKVVVEPDEVFLRKDQDLYYTANVPLIKLLMGGTVEIPWFDQIRTLNINPNTPEDYVFTIPKMGMPYPGRPGQFGNLFIKLKVKGMVDFSEALKE